MLFRSEIAIDDVVLTSENCVKLLGIQIDSKLNFKDHVKSLCNKAGKQLNVLCRLSKFLSFTSRLAIYKSFIMSNFYYCMLVWCFTCKQNIQMIESIQKRALRFVYNDFSSDYESLLCKANAINIPILLLRYTAIETYKNIH